MLYSATDWTFGESSTIQLDLSAQLVMMMRILKKKKKIKNRFQNTSYTAVIFQDKGQYFFHKSMYMPAFI